MSNSSTVADTPRELEINPADVAACRETYAAIQHELAKVIVGQSKVVEEILISIFTKSHALLVGVPGLAKTLLISTLADALHMSVSYTHLTLPTTERV